MKGWDVMPPRSVSLTQTYNLARLREELKPFRLHFSPVMRSTNNHAAKLRERGDLYAPAVVLCSHQTAGRGRRDNTWWSTAGVVTVTFVLPIEKHLEAHQLPLAAGLAVRNACAEITGSSDIQLKWPNDILYNDRKLSGLLSERIHNADLTGVGLNAFVQPEWLPAGLKGRVASLDEIFGSAPSITDVVLMLARHIHRTVARRGERSFADLLLEYDSHHALRGRQVTINTGDEASHPIAGVCEGLDEIGRLKVRTPKGMEYVIAGHVTAR